MNANFDTNTFAAQLISSGSFVDTDPGFGGEVFVVETATVRLNPTAMNEWVDAQLHNCRECYDTEEEWQEYERIKNERQEAFDRKVAAVAGFDAEDGINVTQIVSEVFAVAYIHEVKC